MNYCICSIRCACLLIISPLECVSRPFCLNCLRFLNFTIAIALRNLDQIYNLGLLLHDQIAPKELGVRAVQSVLIPRTLFPVKFLSFNNSFFKLFRSKVRAIFKSLNSLKISHLAFLKQVLTKFL